MTRDQFAKLFEEYQGDARRVLLDKFQGNAAQADDAVQNAAVYVLENIGRFKQLTKSYFIQLAVSRAKNGRRGEARQQTRVVTYGGTGDLVRLEHGLEQRRRGRILPQPGADRMAEVGPNHWTGTPAQQ
jgi:DNA-directed RNA polymerase specialized sigma24 family protein